MRPGKRLSPPTSSTGLRRTASTFRATPSNSFSRSSSRGVATTTRTPVPRTSPPIQNRMELTRRTSLRPRTASQRAETTEIRKHAPTSRPRMVAMPIGRHRRRQRQELHGRRRTIVYGSAYGEHPGDSLYPHMLIEDIGLRVMPLGRRWTEREFSVELVPVSERFEALITDALKPEG